MEIRTEPWALKVDRHDNVCPCCSNALQQETKSGSYLIYECGYCRYLDRPFGGCGSTAETHYGGCSCEYGNKDYLYISCNHCLTPTCLRCGDKQHCSGNGCNKIICTKCVNNEKFTKNWNTSSPQEKLNV